MLINFTCSYWILIRRVAFYLYLTVFPTSFNSWYNLSLGRKGPIFWLPGLYNCLFWWSILLLSSLSPEFTKRKFVPPFLRPTKRCTWKMKLNDTVIRKFRVAKVFKENSDKINSIDFYANGETLISSSDDESIVIYDCQNGT